MENARATVAQSVTLYATLGVPPDADAAAIRRAYRRAAKHAHPDAGGAPDRWTALQLAHDVLSDGARRAEYDRTGSTEAPKQNAAFQAAVGWISRALNGVLEKAVGNNERVTQVDLIERVRRWLQQAVTEAHQTLVKADQQRAIFVQIQGRFETKADSNVMEALIAAQLDGLADAKRRIEADLTAFAMALRMLEQVRYRRDALPPDGIFALLAAQQRTNRTYQEAISG